MSLTFQKVCFCDALIPCYPEQKFGWHIRYVTQSLAIYTHNAIQAPAPGRLKGMCHDAKDDMIFEWAVNSHAKLIVSGDHGWRLRRHSCCD